MKRIVFMALAAAFVLTGCRNKIEEVSVGTLSLEVQQSAEGFNVVTKANDNIDDFVIEIARPKDNWSVEYVYGDIKGDMVNLGSGEYTITAHSAEQSDAAWELPYYSASQTFTITPGEVTPINLVCELTNVKVTIVLSEGFKQELSTYNVVVSNGRGKLTWVKDENVNDFESGKAGYFSVAPLEIDVNGHRAIDNTSASTTMAIQNVVARNHHIITIDAKVTGQLGGDTDGDGVPDSGIVIGIDYGVDPKDEYVIVDGLEEIPVAGGEDGEDGGDEEGGDTPPAVDPNLPVLTWPGNTNPSIFDPVTIDANLDADMVIHAAYGIKEFKVYVESEKLAPIVSSMVTNKPLEDGVAVMDMIGDPETVANAGNLGLPTGDALENVTTPIDFQLTQLVKLIPDLADAGESFHYFTLYLVDNEGNVLNNRLTFRVVK